MSSLFKGLAEHVKNHAPVYTPQRSSISNLFLAQVLDVITGEQVQNYLASGQASKDNLDPAELYKFVGAIRIKIQEYDDNRYEDTTLRYAFPLDRGNFRLPVVGELVLVVKAYIVTDGAGSKDYFYAAILGGATQSTRHAVRPNAVTTTSKVNQPPWYEQKQGSGNLGGAFGDSLSSIGQVLSQAGGSNADKQAAAAKRFETKYQHDTSNVLGTPFTVPTMREGDHIIEGRFGGTIRFTGTLTQKNAWPDTPYAQHMLKGSKDGDPMLLIKVPSTNLSPAQAALSAVPEKMDDNINDDASSVYLNTTQSPPIELKTSKKMFTWAYDIEKEPDSVFGKVDVGTTTIQATISQVYNPNDIIQIAAVGVVDFGGLAGSTTTTTANSTGDAVTTGEYQAVLIAGLDGEGYKPLDEQVALLQTSFSGKIKGFRYNAPDSEILAFLKEVPNIHVFMFSAGCRKAEIVSKSPDVILDKIYIIEPYAVNGNGAVVNAVKNGVPARHVFVGSSTATGKDVVPGAVSSNAPSHWKALAKGGEFIGT